MNRAISRNQSRNNTGSVLVLSVLILTFVVIPVGMFLFKYSLSLTTQSRYQNQLEAVALLAAEHLSRIVVNDSHFGYVSLSNQPPIGQATLAADGEPCPVTSINSLLATIRLDMLIAHERHDDNLCTLVNADYEQAKITIKLLQSALDASVDPDSKESHFDMDGNQIKAYADAQDILSEILQPVQVQSQHPVPVRNLNISLGWLRRGGTTNTPIAKPVDMAQIESDSQQNGKYKSCVDIPAFGHSFYFAPTAESSCLVDETMFADPDGKRICSAVKVDADIAEGDHWLHVVACAVPGERAQHGPTGALMVFFPCGLTDLRNLDEMLHLQGGEVTQSYTAKGGDLPVDPDASTAPAELLPWRVQDVTANRVTAAGLYCWLRAAGVRPRIDSTMSALCQEFRGLLKSNNLLYEFDPEGNVVISSLPCMPLPISVLSDQQLFVETSCHNYSIGCYNNVYNLGTVNGGKHAGQLMEGDPINWCDLPYFGLSADLAMKEGKGLATGLTAINTKQAVSPIPGAVLKDLAEFETNGKAVSAAPRKSYYSGGLAVELAISQF